MFTAHNGASFTAYLPAPVFLTRGHRGGRLVLLNRALVGQRRMADAGLAEVVKWQTRYVQGVVGAIPWRFKSSLRHRADGWRRRE